MKFLVTFFTMAIATQLSAMEIKTATHVGFSVEQDSTTGFKDVGGSMLFLDLALAATDKIDVGMRTMAQGGQAEDSEFYRTGSGPFVSWSFNKDWSLQAGVAFFKEAALGTSADHVTGHFAEYSGETSHGVADRFAIFDSAGQNSQRTPASIVRPCAGASV